MRVNWDTGEITGSRLEGVFAIAKDIASRGWHLAVTEDTPPQNVRVLEQVKFKEKSRAKAEGFVAFHLLMGRWVCVLDQRGFITHWRRLEGQETEDARRRE